MREMRDRMEDFQSVRVAKDASRQKRMASLCVKEARPHTLS